MSKYSDISKAMDIFVKYEDSWLEADRDILYGPRFDTNFTAEEKKTLEELGWFLSDEYDCWCCHC